MRLCSVLAVTATALICQAVLAQAQHLQITSFSVGPDQTLTYPNNSTDPGHLVNLPDEHTTFFPPAASGAPYLIFAASKISGGTGGAVVLQTTDLKTFDFATALGYNRQVMGPPIAIDQCNSAYQTEFDGNYAAPGSVVQDPTLPPGNLMILYEAENHCPGGVNQQPFYATVGFARSSDNGKTWPAPQNGPLGGPSRHPVLQSSDPQPSVAHPPMGDSIPSAFVDKSASGDYYLYVTYGYHAASGVDGLLRVARAKLGSDPLTFLKWYNGSFSQPGVGGLDSGVTPSAGCPNGVQHMGEISYNDDLGLYLMIFVCESGPTGARVGAWYYSTATSLDLQNWTAPKMVQNSQLPLTSPCPGLTSGGQFDGYYPSTVSPGAASGHTKLTGNIFFLSGCDTGPRVFMSRTFTITAVPATNVPTVPAASVVNNASFAPGTTPLAPGSIAAIFGSNLTDGTSCLHAQGCDQTLDPTTHLLKTTLAGAQVSVNGTPVPIYYASPGQLGIQIPFELIGSSANVAVSVAGQASTPISVPLTPVSPGIFFTATADGTNAGAINHENTSPVTPQNPAQRGEVVILYATGLGQVTPAVPTGALPTGISSTVAPVTLTVGGINVMPEFAGLAGCCAGLNQINFRVPPGVSLGNAVPVVLSIGGKSSNTATIAVQ